MSYTLSLDGRRVEVQIKGRRPHLTVAIDGIVRQVSEAPCAPGAFEVTLDGIACRGWRCMVGDEIWIRLGARCFVVGLPQTLWNAGDLDALEREIRADMPGVVVAVHCEAGQAVERGDKLLTIESMKLQMSLTAAHQGIVEAIHVAAEGVFARGARLITFASPAAAERTPGQEPSQ